MNGVTTTRYECTITGCDWAHERADLGPEDVGLLGGISETLHRLAEETATVETTIREHFETHTAEEWAREVASLREQLAVAGNVDAPAPQPWIPMCTPCLVEAKQAQLRGGPVPEVNGVATFANGVGICEVRHGIQVEPPSLLIAQPGQVPAFGG